MRPLPVFTAAAGLTASTCGTRSASELLATASTRRIRASVSGRVEWRRPSRTARTASSQSLVLARGKVLAPVFMSIEEYLGRNTQKYYDVLAEVGRGSWQPENDARPWLRFILTAHLRQARTMLIRIRESERLWVELELLIEQFRLPERVMLPMFDAAVGLRVRNATYRATLEESGEEPITEQTASRDFQRLVEAALLVPSGERRGRFYTASEGVAQIQRRIRADRDPRNDSDPFAD